MPIYESCERYSLGIGECCGATHEKQRNAFRRIARKDFLILRYSDGSEIQIPKYNTELMEPRKTGRIWVTWTEESPELTDLLAKGDFNHLDNESKIDVLSVHPHTMHCVINPDCEFIRPQKPQSGE